MIDHKKHAHQVLFQDRIHKAIQAYIPSLSFDDRQTLLNFISQLLDDQRLICGDVIGCTEGSLREYNAVINAPTPLRMFEGNDFFRCLEVDPTQVVDKAYTKVRDFRGKEWEILSFLKWANEPSESSVGLASAILATSIASGNPNDHNPA
ncbi:hypothetical protein [Chitinophaga sp. sic0106]|uniref:hypothetical protein n=1 Tax=Chitinophaga sp. sic0106 TaxID=2854785 RepID=UPI001C462715|nr:hypothetical protein [Chitinophaga sp. sic0106]MBV7529023.1 hypothetical protein [Chitinophaga sp. sic0106]